jgi:hypothetical protein
MPRRGSWFTISTSSAMVRTPSPTTWPGTRLAAATSSPLTTSMRWSKPAMKDSRITVSLCSRACSYATRTCSSQVSPMETPRPWLASSGLITSGKPMMWAASMASSTVSAVRWRATGRPSSPRMRLVSSLSEAISTEMCRVSLVTVASMRFWTQP